MNHRTRVFALILIFLLGVMISAQENRLQIVASHSILGDVVQQVAGDAADVAITMPRGADPHGFEPTPSDLTALAQADVVFVNGAFFEEGLLEAIENAGSEMTIVEASDCVTIIGFDGEHDHGDDHADEHSDDDHADEHSSEYNERCGEHVAELEQFHAEGDDHSHGYDHALGALHVLDCGGGHEEDNDHGDEEHSHGACDPHVWMVPHNVMLWTMQIRDTLIDLDPDNAETYTANAAAYLETLEALQHDFIEPLMVTLPEENRVMVTSHDSFGYFAAAYDFNIITTIIPGGSTAAEPSARDVAAVIDAIRAEGVPAVFGETTVSDTVTRTIADETGAELVVLYTGSLSEADGPAATYVEYIRYNYTAIVEALGGGL